MDRSSLATAYAAFDSDPQAVVEFLAWLAAPITTVPGVRVLDVGCGIGRLFDPVAALGWHIVGMEPNPELLQKAHDVAEGLASVEVRRGSFTDVAEQATDRGAFDIVAGINGSFAHVLTPELRAGALRRCRTALRAGGLIVLDLPNLLRILHEYRAPAVQEVVRRGTRFQLTRRHVIDYHDATFTTLEHYVAQEQDGTRWEARLDHVYAITTLPELTDLLHECGFANVRTHTSFGSRRAERLGPGRMIIVAEALS